MNKSLHILGDEQTGKLLFKLTVPATIGMLVMALYNIVDTIYVGRGVGHLAITAIIIVLPIHMLMLAAGMLSGIGGASVLSRSLGERNFTKAQKSVGNVYSSIFIISLLIAIPGLIFIEPLVKIFGASERVIEYSISYLRVILYGTFFFTFAIASNSILRAQGKAKLAMYSMIISAGLNIILDPIFIYTFKLGITGAAIATVISQAVTAIYLLIYLIHPANQLRLKLQDFIPDFKLIKEILAIGTSAFARQIATSVLIILLNRMVKGYGGDIAIAAIGVTNRLIMFFLMPVFGIAQGFQPIAGYNFGAKRYDKVKDVFWKAAVASTYISFSGFILFFFFSRFFISFFTNNRALIEISVSAMRLGVLALYLVGFQVIGATFFQAVGKSIPALILSLSRQIVIYVPVLFILSHYFGLTGVWLTSTVADILSFIITIFFLKRESEKLLGFSLFKNMKFTTIF